MPDEMKKLITAVKTELKAEIGEMRGEIGAVRTELDGRLDAHDGWLRRISVEQTRARGDIEWLKENMVSRAEFKSAFSQIMGHLSGLTALHEEFRLRWAVQSDTLSGHRSRLDDHEARLSVLEMKRA